MKRMRSFFYMVISFTLLLYGVPRFHLNGIQSIEEGFAILWTFFALLVIGAHLFRWLEEPGEPQAPGKYPEMKRIRSFQRR
ncbi:hypothetical protein [Thermicanus aegyptius]|uniref:hypothetical protein n=1 Tax=Thermicanus aegyptius TaxID=94009 RepID=UPI0003F59AED|nr:hypothetical protein [Thermicanus aegyptius]